MIEWSGRAHAYPVKSEQGADFSRHGEDLAKDWSDEVQKLTDQFIKKVDEALTDKEKDIRQV